VSLFGHSERLSLAAGKKCVAKCATQFLLIGGCAPHFFSEILNPEI